LTPFLDALLVIGLAELGDKTQLLTFGFATRFPFWKVISAVALASGILMAIAVLFGEVIYRIIPSFYVSLFAGLYFLGYGIYMLFGQEEEEEEKNVGARSPFMIVFIGFFLAELGDKTQLATLALSARYGTPLQVWLGATLGMVGVNSVSVLAGKLAKGLVEPKWLKYLGAAVFLIFGTFMLADLYLHLH
jgi:putative Ca2+/H+ antiporter (TMEM165/GDT1 family)